MYKPTLKTPAATKTLHGLHLSLLNYGETEKHRLSTTQLLHLTQTDQEKTTTLSHLSLVIPLALTPSGKELDKRNERKLRM